MNHHLLFNPQERGLQFTSLRHFLFPLSWLPKWAYSNFGIPSLLPRSYGNRGSISDKSWSMTAIPPDQTLPMCWTSFFLKLTLLNPSDYMSSPNLEEVLYDIIFLQVYCEEAEEKSMYSALLFTPSFPPQNEGVWRTSFCIIDRALWKKKSLCGYVTRV